MSSASTPLLPDVLARHSAPLFVTGGLWQDAFLPRFAGHNKWSKIKKTKGAADAAKATVTTKIAKEIGAAVKAAGPDPLFNLRLAYALDKAKVNNVPKVDQERDGTRTGEGDREAQTKGALCGTRCVSTACGRTCGRARFGERWRARRVRY